MVNFKNLQSATITIKEMLLDRGYKLEESKTDNDLVEEYKNTNCSIIGSNNNEKIIAVFYDNSSNQKIGLECVKKLIQKYILADPNIKYTNMISVFNNRLTYRARKELSIDGIDSEIFYIDELYVNIMKHELQPSFRLIRENEKKKIEKYYKNKLPFILKDDMVSRYFNAKIGDTFEILRKDGSIYYRMVA